MLSIGISGGFRRNTQPIEAATYRRLGNERRKMAQCTAFCVTLGNVHLKSRASHGLEKPVSERCGTPHWILRRIFDANTVKNADKMLFLYEEMLLSKIFYDKKEIKERNSTSLAARPVC
jgi:hypothetical protein